MLKKMIVVTCDQRVDVELINNVVSYLEKAKSLQFPEKKKSTHWNEMS